MTLTSKTIDRDEAITRIKAALKRRSGKAWSVTGGRGTAWGWITIDASPSRRTWHFENGRPNSRGGTDHDEVNDPSKPFGHTGPDERAELAKLLGLAERVHFQGESIPAGSDYHQEYVDRAEGKTPSVIGEQYWD